MSLLIFLAFAAGIVCGALAVLIISERETLKANELAQQLYDCRTECEALRASNHAMEGIHSHIATPDRAALHYRGKGY